MIKITIEFVRSAATNEDNPALRMIVFESETYPELQNQPFWIVQNIIQFGTERIDALEQWISDYLQNDTCLELALRPELGPGIVIDTHDGDPAEPYIYPVLRAVYKKWMSEVDPLGLEAALGEGKVT